MTNKKAIMELVNKVIYCLVNCEDIEFANECVDRIIDDEIFTADEMEYVE